MWQCSVMSTQWEYIYMHLGTNDLTRLNAELNNAGAAGYELLTRRLGERRQDHRPEQVGGNSQEAGQANATTERQAKR